MIDFIISHKGDTGYGVDAIDIVDIISESVFHNAVYVKSDTLETSLEIMNQDVDQIPNFPCDVIVTQIILYGDYKVSSRDIKTFDEYLNKLYNKYGDWNDDKSIKLCWQVETVSSDEKNSVAVFSIFGIKPVQDSCY